MARRRGPPGDGFERVVAKGLAGRAPPAGGAAIHATEHALQVC